MSSLPLNENMGTFYREAWVKRPFGKVSENLEYQMNESFKEYIDSHADSLVIARNCCCLAYVIKNNQSVVKR